MGRGHLKCGLIHIDELALPDEVESSARGGEGGAGGREGCGRRGSVGVGVERGLHQRVSGHDGGGWVFKEGRKGGTQVARFRRRKKPDWRGGQRALVVFLLMWRRFNGKDRILMRGGCFFAKVFGRYR